MTFTYLSNHPVVGIASGFGSGMILTIQSFFTNEVILKIVAGCGVWLGAIVALLTLILKTIEFLTMIYKFFKNKKEVK